MAGNKIGGKKAAATNIKLHGDDFYRRIGEKGGRNGHTGGFAANPTLASTAGRKGGMISRRGQGYKKQIEANAELIMKMYIEEEKSAMYIARIVGIPYNSVRLFIKENIK